MTTSDRPLVRSGDGLPLGEAARDGSQAKILLVCSKPDDIAMFRTALGAVGYSRAIAAHSAETARSILDGESADLALIDQDLHPDGGLKFLSLVKQRYPRLPCVLIIGQHQVHIAKQALGVGGDDYLLKDEVLTLAMRSVLDHLLGAAIPQSGEEEHQEMTAYRALRRIYLLVQSIGLRLSYQRDWERISKELFDIFDCDAWGYAVRHEQGLQLHRFQRADMSPVAQEKLLVALRDAFAFHGDMTVTPGGMTVRVHQYGQGLEIGFPFRDLEMPMFSGGELLGMAFMVYRSPLRLTAQRLELFKVMTSYIAQILDIGRIITRLSLSTMLDPVAQCHNRRYFLEMLDVEGFKVERYGQTFSLVLIDVDHFKDINHRYGYEAGDELLAGMARLLQRQIRRIDIMARIGGEEFAVILPNTGYEGAKVMANRVRDVLEKTTFTLVGGAGVKTTATLTMGTYVPEVHLSGEGLLIRLERLLALQEGVSNAVVPYQEGQAGSGGVGSGPGGGHEAGGGG